MSFQVVAATFTESCFVVSSKTTLTSTMLMRLFCGASITILFILEAGWLIDSMYLRSGDACPDFLTFPCTLCFQRQGQLVVLCWNLCSVAPHVNHVQSRI